jgi:hypothetical protein
LAALVGLAGILPWPGKTTMRINDDTKRTWTAQGENCT